MRKSKYVGKSFGNWTCTGINIANVQGKRSKAPGHCNYSYTFERLTSDKACEKIINLNSTEASMVYNKITTVEDLLNKRETKKSNTTNRKISYRFVD